jgi:hypothetical protein
MKKKKENIEIDIFVDPKPLTEEEQQLISDFIKKEKLQNKSSKTSYKSKYIRTRV